MKAILLKLLAAATLLVMLGGTTLAQPLTFDQATTCGSGEGNAGWGPRRMIVDAQGNTYVVGSFTGSIVLGSNVLNAPNGVPGQPPPADLFIAKLDAAGNYIWAVQGGGQAYVTSEDLFVDAAGNVYITGYFDDYSVRFGAGGPILFNSSASSEAYVAKLDGMTHQWQWAQRCGGAGQDVGRAVAVNSSGEVYLSGSFYGTTANFGPFTLTNPQGLNACWAKLDANGMWLWARQLGTGSLLALDLIPDSQGAIYVAGSFKAPAASLGSITLTTQAMPTSPTPQGGDIFVAKANGAGNWLWAVQGDALNGQNIAELGGLAYNGAGKLYVCGEYCNAAARFGSTVLPNLSIQRPQPNPLPPVPYTNNYYSDGFVAQLDAGTGAWQWATRTGGSLDEYMGGITADGQGRVCVGGGGAIGAFGGADFGNPLVGSGRVNLAGLDGSTGTWRWALATTPVVMRNLAFDATGHLHLSGHFYNTAASFGSITLVGAGPGLDTGYIARMSVMPLSTASFSSLVSGGLAVWPNPVTNGSVQIQGPLPGQVVQVLDVLGRIVATRRMPAAGPLQWLLALPVGMYVVRAGGQARRLVVE